MKTPHEAGGTNENGVWDWDTGIAGLVRHRTSGRYYSRFQINRKRTMRALKTDDFAKAKLKHFELLAGAERQRQTGTAANVGKGSMDDLLTLALATHGENSELTAKTKLCFSLSVDRLKRHWPECFDRDLATQKPDKITGEMAERFANSVPGTHPSGVSVASASRSPAATAVTASSPAMPESTTRPNRSMNST